METNNLLIVGKLYKVTKRFTFVEIISTDQLAYIRGEIKELKKAIVVEPDDVLVCIEPVTFGFYSTNHKKNVYYPNGWLFKRKVVMQHIIMIG